MAHGGTSASCLPFKAAEDHQAMHQQVSSVLEGLQRTIEGTLKSRRASPTSCLVPWMLINVSCTSR